MENFSDERYNPNPITKMIVVFILGLLVLHPLNQWFSVAMTMVIALGFMLNGKLRVGAEGLLIYLLIFKIPGFEALESIPMFLKMFASIVIVVRMFYLPFFAGKFLISTSDVGSILTSMDKVRTPKTVSIPVAVMFRFFPSYKEERANIKMAMKIRGISFVNPISYLKYITVPLLILSSNIADDISKAAEVKAIENPIEKTRYIEVKIKAIDFFYIGITGIIVVGGLLC